MRIRFGCGLDSRIYGIALALMRKFFERFLLLRFLKESLYTCTIYYISSVHNNINIVIQGDTLARGLNKFGKSIPEFGETHSSVLGCEKRPVSASIMSRSCLHRSRYVYINFQVIITVTYRIFR